MSFIYGWNWRDSRGNVNPDKLPRSYKYDKINRKSQRYKKPSVSQYEKPTYKTNSPAPSAQTNQPRPKGTNIAYSAFIVNNNNTIIPKNKSVANTIVANANSYFGNTRNTHNNSTIKGPGVIPITNTNMDRSGIDSNFACQNSQCSDSVRIQLVSFAEQADECVGSSGNWQKNISYGVVFFTNKTTKDLIIRQTTYRSGKQSKRFVFLRSCSQFSHSIPNDNILVCYDWLEITDTRNIIYPESSCTNDDEESTTSEDQNSLSVQVSGFSLNPAWFDGRPQLQSFVSSLIGSILNIETTINNNGTFGGSLTSSQTLDGESINTDISVTGNVESNPYINLSFSITGPNFVNGTQTIFSGGWNQSLNNNVNIYSNRNITSGYTGAAGWMTQGFNASSWNIVLNP